jgi:hypothetical protein
MVTIPARDGHYPRACASRLPAAGGGLPPEAAGSCVDGGFAGADHQIHEFPFDAVPRGKRVKSGRARHCVHGAVMDDAKDPGAKRGYGISEKL